MDLKVIENGLNIFKPPENSDFTMLIPYRDEQKR